jgi:hypothetical protein
VPFKGIPFSIGTSFGSRISRIYIKLIVLSEFIKEKCMKIMGASGHFTQSGGNRRLSDEVAR